MVTRVEFLGLVPTLYAHCQSCMELMDMCELEPYYEQLKEYPKEVVETYYNVTKMILDLKKEFGDKIFVDVIDTTSLQGIWTSIKYRIFKTPAIAINGKKAFSAIPRYEELRSKVAEELATSALPTTISQASY